MSKLSNLKQEAFQAGKKRNWDEAVVLYERILDLDKNNPTLINELGDLCLKAGEIQRGIRHFINAAAKYRHTGLYNNSVAIYKKILRYDDSNLNAHWYLAETRASQGLVMEGELHGNKFLDSSEKVSGDIKEIFLKRCLKLFELFPDSTTIIERLSHVFRMYHMSMEVARVTCLLACQAWDRSEGDKAREIMEKLLAETPEISNYAEFGKWMSRVDPDGVGDASAFADFNSIDLDPGDTSKSAGAGEETGAKPASTKSEEIPDKELPWGTDGQTESSDEEAPVLDADQEAPASAPDEEIPVAQDKSEEADTEVDDDGCISIEIDEDTSLSELVEQAAHDVEGNEESAEEAQEPTTETSFADAIKEVEEESSEESVDLLAEILAQEEDDSGAGDNDQLTTISQEIGAQLGGSDGDKDPGQFYEMGLVYLEMGLFDQACESFEMAASDVAYQIRAVEMWGIALMRANRPEDAVAILTKAESVPEQGSREHLGILYHLGMAHEQAGDADQAVTFFQRIQDVDSSYHDVSKRMARLVDA